MPTSVTTVEQRLSLREPGMRHELVRGELRRMSLNGHWHDAVASQVLQLIGGFAASERLGCTFGGRTGFQIARDPDTVRAADVAFVVNDRLPRRTRWA